MTRSERIARLHQVARERVLILDGAWGVMIQKRGLAEADYRGERFADHPSDLKGNNDLLILTRPDIITDLHDAYYGAGADISETNTFSSTSIGMADYGMESQVRALNLEAARLGRESADRWTAKEPHKPRFLAGSIGPLNRTLSISPDVNDPAARSVTFDEVYNAYREQVLALHEGGVDLFLVETIFDTLNAKAAIFALDELMEQTGERLPVIISGTGFSSPATVAFSGTGITVRSVTVDSATQITAIIDLDRNAAISARMVTVTVGGSPAGTLAFSSTSSHWR